MPATSLAPTPSDRVFDALGNPVRRAILQQLRAHPRSVQDIASAFDVSRPAVSKHLRLLKDARLVEHEAAGRENIYRLNQRGIEVAHRWLSAFWDDALESFAALAEATAKTEDT